MLMVVPIAAMRVEHRDVAPLERLPLDGAIEIVEALRPAAYQRTQHDRGVLVKGCAEHRWHRQDDMPRDDAFVEDPADLAHPVVHGDFGAAQAQGGFAAHRHHVLPLTTVGRQRYAQASAGEKARADQGSCNAGWGDQLDTDDRDGGLTCMGIDDKHIKEGALFLHGQIESVLIIFSSPYRGVEHAV